jgi:hypothetical protein
MVPNFFIHRLGIVRSFKFVLEVNERTIVGRSIRKRRKKWGSSFQKIDDDVIAQKPMTLFKQIAHHGWQFELKSTCRSDFLKNFT